MDPNKQVDENRKNDRDGPPLYVGVVGISGLAILVVWATVGPSIPNGPVQQGAARSTLKELYPDREVVPLDDDVTAPVAALYHVIRYAEDEKAIRALESATRNGLGYAAPYAVERLENGSPELRAAALRYLRWAGRSDLGESPEAWRAWWNNPPRRLFGFTIGQRTVEFAAPVLAGLWMVFLWWLAGVLRLWKGLKEFEAWLWVFLAPSAFVVLAELGNRFIGASGSCTFGPDTIRYWHNHGQVVGLHDGRAGGMGLWVVMVIAYVAIPSCVLVIAKIVRRRRRSS